MKVSLIAAIAENGVIGKDNQLIWQISEDLKFFKRTTSGHHIIMGRKNYESIGRPLPNRTNVIITRNRNYVQEGCEIVYSLDEALLLAKNNGDNEVMIIGGGEIYKQSLEKVDKMYITRVHETFEGDTYFPQVEWSNWQLVSEDLHEKDENCKHDFTICIYEKLS